MLTDTEVELFVDFRDDLIGINDEEAEGADTVELFEFGVRVVDVFGELSRDDAMMSNERATDAESVVADGGGASSSTGDEVR